MKLSTITTLLFIVIAFSTKAQSLTAISQKIKSLHNASYTGVVKFKFSFQDEASVDTFRTQVLIVPAEKQIGGYYKIVGKREINLFDGDKRIGLNLTDTTYKMDRNANASQYTRVLPYWAKQIDKYSKEPRKISQLKDTLINNRVCVNFFIKITDTIQKKEHIYSLAKVVADKQTLLPVIVREEFRGFADDGAVGGMEEQHTFIGYQINKRKFPDLSNAVVPPNFKIPVKEKLLPMLTDGTVAPPLFLKGFDGKNLNIESLKGKMVLLNFTTTGCAHCVNAAQMLMRLNEKYKNTNFIIVSIYQSKFNDQKSVAKFDNKFNIKYPSYLTDQDAHKDYHIQGYPNFYLLDKQGVIAKNFDGFYSSLEKEMTDKIDQIK